jgi:hypothetical protein
LYFDWALGMRNVLLWLLLSVIVAIIYFREEIPQVIQFFTVVFSLPYRDTFKADTWTCGKSFGDEYEVHWEPKGGTYGTNIMVRSPTKVTFFALSCLPSKKSNCFDNPGWGGARIDVTGASEPVSISFTRESVNVDDSYRHHVTVYWDLARSIIAAFKAGKAVDISTLGAKGEVLKVTKVNLDGFETELDKCMAIWAKEPKKP